MLAIAHRAGNSLAGLQAAEALGADVIEADVHSYRGRLEVRHRRTMGPLPWLWDRWELASAGVPRLGLAALLQAAAASSTFMLDLKGEDPAVGEHVARELRRLAPQRPVIVCSRAWPALAPFARLPWARTVRSARHRHELARLLRHHDGAARAGGGDDVGDYGVSLHRSLLSADVVARLHTHVEVVMTWPVDDAAALEALRPLTASGTVGVISNSPAVLRRVLTGADGC